MTDAEMNARKEIELLKKYDRLNKSAKVAPLDVVNKANRDAKNFKDKDGNNIYEFFIVNGQDNHNLKDKDKFSPDDVHLMITDEIKAIHGDTNVLLAE